MLFYMIVLLVVALDQGSKMLIRTHMEVGDSAPIWNHFIHFTYYQNSGTAGSSFQRYGRIFIVFAVLVVEGVLYYRSKGELKGFVMVAGTGFLIGGAIGNAIDRVLFNKVTDFIVFRSGHGVLKLADLVNFSENIEVSSHKTMTSL
jgi:signal peptidase II